MDNERALAALRCPALPAQAPGKNSREVLHLEAFELLASAELDGHEASPPWFSSEEAAGCLDWVEAGLVLETQSLAQEQLPGVTCLGGVWSLSEWMFWAPLTSKFGTPL